VGQIASAAAAAEAIVLVAADALDAISSVIGNDEATAKLAHEAAVIAAKAKVVVDDLTVRSAAQLFDVGGASATKRSYNLDLYWRNARTLASHNPAAYKARAIGDYEINGSALPALGFF
jgi:alkylation response protein AidB-like acyl-CoA dehydrogenase